MKVLKLNKKQEKLLISMCQEFFPEYHDTNRLFEIQGDEDMILMFDGNKYTKIHWYQLCLTELSKRIWNSIVVNHNNIDILCGKYGFINLTYIELSANIILSKEHPVEYLQKFIKFCKSNKHFKTIKNDRTTKN